MAPHLTNIPKSENRLTVRQLNMHPHSPNLGKSCNDDISDARKFTILWEEGGSLAENFRALRAEGATVPIRWFEAATQAGKLRVRAFQGLGKKWISNSLRD
jgi:hypothetical protein